MSLLEKSKENYNAYLRLRDHNDCNSPIIHACYYSCYQLVMLFLKTFYTEEYESLSLTERNSHKDRLNRFVSHYYDLDRKSATKIKRHLFALKDLRIRSDYSETIITPNDVEKSGEHCEGFHKILKGNAPALFNKK